MTQNLLEWHKSCYENWKSSLDKHEERIIRELEKIKEDRKRLDFYKFQIDESEKLGKLAFDRDKFRIKKS